MASSAPDDPNPFGSYFFALEITEGDDGPIEVAHFMECSGLKSSTAVFEIEEGGLNSRTHKRPAGAKWENIVLKYATSTSTYLLGWRDRILRGDYGSRLKFSGSITLRSNEGTVLRRYAFRNAWPVSWEGPAFSGGSSDLAIETLELAHEGLIISGKEG